MDHADMADKDILEFLDRAISAARGLKVEAAPPGLNSIYCSDCGIEIPPARRAAVVGCNRCIDCAEIMELKHRGSVRPVTQNIQYADLDDSLSSIDI